MSFFQEMRADLQSKPYLTEALSLTKTKQTIIVTFKKDFPDYQPYHTWIKTWASKGKDHYAFTIKFQNRTKQSFKEFIL